MTKAELLDRIIRSQKLPPDMTKKAVAEVLDVAFAELKGYFVQGQLSKKQSIRFSYPGFGTFTKKRRPSRKGVHPRTLEAIRIEGFDTIDFKPAADFKRALNPTRKEGSRSEGGTGLAGPSLAGPSGRRLLSRDDAELEAVDLPSGSLRSSATRSAGGRRRVSRK